MQRLIPLRFAAVGIVLAVTACTNQYDPGQRAIAGGLIGAGSGAAIGAVAAGGTGAAAGALIGGAAGAIGGAVTTPHPPPAAYYSPTSHYYGSAPAPSSY